MRYGIARYVFCGDDKTYPTKTKTTMSAPICCSSEAFESAIRRHDAAIETAGLCFWHGSEPTFTDRSSEAPEWLYAACGAAKQAKAGAMVRRLHADFAPVALIRSVGRQYPGEERPRWSYGLLGRRDHVPLWHGPDDPLLGGGASPAAAISRFRDALIRQFEARGNTVLAFESPRHPPLRVMFRTDGALPDPETEARLHRPSPHAGKTPDSGLVDDLAREGVYLLAIGWETAGEEDGEAGGGIVRVELPAIARVEDYRSCLEALAAAARAAELQGLILAGHPPPLDGSLVWHTVTPDPAVVEVNMAPAAELSECLAWLRRIYAAAGEAGLSPYRFQYNGDATDSGGGGHITFGGPSPEASPFLLRPHLLPNLIRYCNRHPSLSYFFTPFCAGSSSQSPRTDETSREAFHELRLTLELLARCGEVAPATLWEALAPFLRDASGNSHRSEINVEKLWNAHLPGRGCLGLVELRAFRMAPDPEALAARIALFRALLGMLSTPGHAGSLMEWGRQLHDRFALPFHLKRDLREVFRELRESGFGLDEVLEQCLLDDGDRVIGRFALESCELTVTRALEFWPLVGDSASQETGTSRLIDSSSSRIEILLRADAAPALDAWQLAVAGRRVPLRAVNEEDGEKPARLCGVRYRAFAPWRGLHPTLGAQTPVAFTLSNGASGRAYRITLHEWKPAGGGYAGLPADWPESTRRRQERLVLEKLPAEECVAVDPPEGACTEWCIDLRWLGGLPER